MPVKTQLDASIIFIHWHKSWPNLPKLLADTTSSDNEIMLLTLIAFFAIIFSSTAHSLELVVVQSVSIGGEGFVTRNGTEYGILQGQEMTFITDDLSMVCRADKVTRHYTHWRPVDPKAKVPFEREEIVTMERSSEKIWSMFNPEEIKSDGVRFPYALIGRFHYSKGLSQSVSGVDDVDVDRTGNVFEGAWRWKFSRLFSWGVGLRFERELTQSEVADVLATRYFLLSELTYHFGRADILSSLDPYFGATLGIGRSSSTVVNSTQSGMAYILPRMRLGLEFEPWKEMGLQIEGAMEALNATEQFNSSGAQVTNQISWSIGFGFISLYR